MSEKQDIKRLPDGELEVMLAIWQENEPVSSSHIQQKLAGKLNWPLSSLMTVLARLIEKGFVACEKRGRNNFYSALIEEQAYKQAEGSSFLGKLYGNSLTSLVSTLYNGKAIGQEDLDELKTFLAKLEEGE